MTTKKPKHYDRPIGLNLEIDIDGPEWALTSMNNWLPMLRRCAKNVEWLLEIAHTAAAASGMNNERAAVERLRNALRELVKGQSGRVREYDLAVTATLLMYAFDRDLGPVAKRPRSRFRPPTAAEAGGTLDGLAALSMLS